MIRPLIFAGCLLFLFVGARAGEGFSHRLVFGIPLGYQALLDKTTSPNVYSGLQYAGSLGWHAEINRLAFRLDGAAGLANLVNERAITRIQSIRTQVDVGISRQMKAFSWLSWGGQVGFSGSYRLANQWDNSAYLYDAFIDLAPQVLLQRPFSRKATERKIGFIKWNRKERSFRWQASLSYSPLALVSRTPYAGIFHFTANQGTVMGMDTWHWTGGKSYGRWRWMLGLDYELLNGQNFLRLFWQGERYFIREPHNLIQSQQRLGVEFHFNGGKNTCRVCF